GRRSGTRGQRRVRAGARGPGRCARHHGRGPGAFRSPAARLGSGGGARWEHFASCLARAGARRAHGSGRARRHAEDPRRFHGGGGRRRRRGEVDAVKAKVVITDYVWESLDVEKKTLGDLADLVPLKTKKPEEFLDAAKDCDALLNTYAGPITADVMSKMPKCRIIARYGIGVDTIDLDAATQSGIIVTNNPTYCIDEVAEHTMALLLACARKVAVYDRLVRGGRWELSPGKPMFRLSSQTLGLVGFGNIARQVAVRAAAFGMRIVFADPFVQDGQFNVAAQKMALDDLLGQSDFVSVHPPLTPE